MESVMRGKFGVLPPQDSNVVRIFLSSTFGDFGEERNELSRETFPRLQTYCQALGLEFQVVDMRWGVRDENISYHQTSQVCIQEIHNCQRLSLGPSFLAFIGDRYGYRPFPAIIPMEEFQTLLDLGLVNGICTRMLSTWYKLDLNAVEKVYQLVPITDHYQNYSSKDDVLRTIDRDGWWSTFLSLQSTFWSLVKMAVAEGKMTEDRAHIYLQSITEDEIDHGIFRLSSTENSCLCYTRTLSGLQENLTDHLASRYIDVLPDSTLDTESQALLQCLKHHKLPQALNCDPNYHTYSIPWVCGGLCVEVVEHKNYLAQLCEQVLMDVKRLIDNAMKDRTNLYSTLHREVLHHAVLCNNKSESYCDRRDGVLGLVQSYILKSAPHPLVVYGTSGSGKTSVMAKVACCMQNWTASFVIVRFLGTSPQSTTIREVLVSVSQQICSLYGFNLPSFGKMETIDIVQYFRNELLVSIEKIPSKRLVIMLDSIDQLSPVDGAHSMKWLPLFLPPNVRMVVSMLTDKCDCLENVKALLPPSEDSYVQLGPMCVEAGMEMMDLWLSRVGRTITAEQRRIVADAFASFPQPLFLRLIFGQARTWQSYLDSGSLVVSDSVQEALLHFYKDLEVQFGEALVQKSLGYFTSAKSGLTESELEDVLSLDDDVLNDIYQYWDPPVKGVVRIPSLLWKRIRHFIADYIVEQQADGMTVLTWYHRQFTESASNRYVRKDRATKESLHFVLSEFFEGAWGNGVGKSIELKHLNLFLKDANRQVPSQTLKFSDSVYNYRKLSEYPHHLLHSKQISKLKGEVLCCLTWIHTKLRAVGFTAAIRDYLSALEVYKDEDDVSAVCETLSLSGSNLKSDPDFLAGQFLGRLLSALPLSPSISQLLDEARKWIREEKTCVFQPLNDCLISPGGELKGTISGHSQIVLGIEMSESLPLLVSCSKRSGCSVFNVWDITSLECIENISTLKLHGDNLLPAFDHVLTSSYLAAINLHSYVLWNVRTGECIEHIEQFGDGELSCLAATCDCERILVGTKSGCVYFMSRVPSPEGPATLLLDGAVKCIHITPDNGLSLIMSGSDSIAIVDNQSQIIVNSVSYNTANFSVTEVVGSRDGIAYVVAGTAVGNVCFSQLPSLASFTVMEGHSKAVKCVTHSASLNLVVTGSLDKTLCVWDVRKCSVVRRLEGHVDGVWCLDFLPNSSKIVSGSKDDYLKVWDVLSGDCLHTLEGHSSWVSCVKAISTNVIVSGSNDKTIKFWNLVTARTNDSSSSNRHVAQPECIALGSSGVAASGGPDAVKVWNPSDGSCLHTLPTPCSCLTFSCNGEMLIVGTKSGTIIVYSVLDDFSQMKVLAKHRGKIVGLLALSNGSGSFLVSASSDSTLVVWSDHHECTVLSGHDAGVSCITSSQSAKIVASGSQDGGVLLWDLSLLRSSGTLKAHSKTVNCLAFNADCTRLVSGSDDSTARVWNTLDQSCLLVMTYSDSVKTLCFTDLNVFVAGIHCGREQLRSWNSETGECVMGFVGHTHAVMCMVLVDRNTILTGSRDGTVRVWSSETSKVLSSFDLQSQVKHIALSKTPTGECLLAATTKSGPIAFLKFRIALS